MSAQTIKAAALRLFALRGYDGVPLSEIAKEVGIRTPSIYAHFSSKDDLFMAVFEDVLAEHSMRLERLIERLKGRAWRKDCTRCFMTRARPICSARSI
ncbi:TetR/AcrR family transcriptional regulator [Paenibacillus sp. P26]|nr:TetR/AcrR family transcriptional regulator [Paenibacillus sp. P26]